MSDVEIIGTPERTVSRRKFIMGVIAAGATTSSVGYLFKGPMPLLGALTAQGSVETFVTMNVNGQQRRVDILPQETLAFTLRYKLGLTGTKLGCDRAECGACTVLIDAVPHYACSVLTHSVRGRRIVTIEGLADPGGELHPIQQGVVDGAENNPPSFYLSGHYEVARYYSLDEHTATPDVLLVSTALWQDLTPEQRTILSDAADASARLQLRLWREATQTALDAVRAAGVEVVSPDKAPFVAAVEGVYERYRDEPEILALIQDIRKLE